MSRGALITVVLAAVAGAMLASGVMWYRMTVDGFDYTRESWLLITLVWAAPPVGAWAARRWPLMGALLLIASSIVASWYFSDVFGFAPGAIALAVGLETALRSVFERRAQVPA